MRELMGGAREQRQRERELAARSATSQQADAPPRQTADPGQPVDRGLARPGRRRRKFRRPRQRLASEADPNRFDGVIEISCLCLHPFLASGVETQERRRRL